MAPRRVDPVIAKVQALAQNVGGTILAVDNPNGNAGQTAADEYTAWDANHCDPNAANAVVHQISVLIDQARQANPQIDSVVLVGDDSVLPMGRSSRPHETRQRDQLRRCHAVSRIDTGRPAVGRQRSVGMHGRRATTADGQRLRDLSAASRSTTTSCSCPTSRSDASSRRPKTSSGAIQTYLDNSGTLDPSTATSALVTGYDFMNDTADAVATQLNNNGKRNVTELKGAWTPSDLTSRLLGRNRARHHELQRSLRPDRSRHGQRDRLVPSSELAKPANAGKLSRRLLFSMGCHSGLSVSDVSVGTELDWPQAVTGTREGRLYEGNTGYGYGDTDAVALGERLMALYAQALNGADNVGQALMLAKQQYAATTAVLNPFDEKVLQESVFYGLPFYKLSAPLSRLEHDDPGAHDGGERQRGPTLRSPAPTRGRCSTSRRSRTRRRPP